MNWAALAKFPPQTKPAIPLIFNFLHGLRPATPFDSCFYMPDASSAPLASPKLRPKPRPSTRVPPRIESILYPQSYCSLDRSQIHSPFNQEVCLDRF